MTINSYFSDTEAVEACICRLNVMCVNIGGRECGVEVAVEFSPGVPIWLHSSLGAAYVAYSALHAARNVLVA